MSKGLISVTRKFTFDAGHRIIGHESKCKHIHGHTYTAEVTVCAPRLDGLGRVIDFGVLKEVVGGWIGTWWDHNFLCHRDDPITSFFDRSGLNDPDVQIPYVMRVNPTAENMAKELFTCVSPTLESYDLTIMRIRIHETPNCFADYHNPVDPEDHSS